MRAHSWPVARPDLKSFSCFIPGLSVLAGMLAVGTACADTGGKSASGIDFQASYTGESAAVVSGGKSQGADFAGQILLGADFDMATLAGVGGMTIHLDATNRQGRNLAVDHIGNSTSVQEIYGGQNTRLARFTVEQSFLDGRLVVEAGRTVANISFLGSDLCQNFQLNAACGNPTFVFRTSSFTWWPVSSWGAHAQAWLTPEIYVHAGAYEVNPNHARNSDNGLTWSTDGATGAVAPFALGYTTTFANDSLPRRYEIGGWYDSASYSDPLHDASGNDAVLSGQPYATRAGRSGVFARFEQMIWRPDSQSQRGLTLFGVAMTGTSGQLIEDRLLELGFVQRGTFTGRDQDTIGFVVNDQTYSGAALRNLREARAAAGGSGTPPRDQVMMELSYGIQAAQAVRIQPNVQYVIHPDQFNDPARLRDLPDAFIVGLRFDVDLARLVPGLVQ